MSDPANLYIDQFAGYQASFTYLEADGTTPFDVSGWTALMTFRAGDPEGVPMLTVGTGTGEIVVTGGSGLFSLTLDTSQTAKLIVNGYYDIFVTPPASEPIRLVGGAAVVTPAVTRP